MKKILFIALILAQSAVFAQTATWKSDKPHAKLTFSTVHQSISDVAGLFNNFDVTIVSSKPDFSDASFDLTADVNSVNTEVEMRDTHLKSPDFFDAAKFPSMTFKSTSIQRSGKDKYKLSGNLTLHGVTRPVTMDLWYRGTITNAMNKAVTAGFQLTGTLKRSDFGIGAKFPDAMVSDVVQIKADGEFIKQ